MPKSKKPIATKEVTVGNNEGSSASIQKKKMSREKSRIKRVSGFYYGERANGREMTKKKDIAYSNYVRIMERSGDLFADSPVDPSKKCVVRFRKDAKIAAQRLMITYLKG